MEEKDDVVETFDADNTVDDEMELTDIEEGVNDKVKKLREKLKRCEEEKMASLEDLQRAKAEFLNARKRLDEERAKDKERYTISLAEELLPLCDSFDMALADPSFGAAEANLQKGIKGIHSQLYSILNSYGVAAFGAVGEDFDPNNHEAVADVEVESKDQDHKIQAVLQKGYKLGDRVIRPARVAVGIIKN